MVAAGNVRVRMFDGKVEPIPVVTGQRHKIVVTTATYYRFDTSALRCRTGSALLLPVECRSEQHPWLPLMAAFDALEREADWRLILLGHASEEETSDPMALSDARVRGLKAFLDPDRDAWVSVATSNGCLADIKAYLNYLGNDRRWPCYAGKVNNTDDETAQLGLKQFQNEYNRRYDKHIEVDGICGEETRGAVFDVLLDELQRFKQKYGFPEFEPTLHEDVPTLAAGSAALGSVHFFGRQHSGARQALDLLVVRPDTFENATPGLKVVLEDKSARYVKLPVLPDPGAWEYGEISVFVHQNDPAREHLRYQLRSATGDYNRVLSAADDGEPADDFVELVFDWVPVEAELTLVAHNQEDTITLFEDVPYADVEVRAPTGGLKPTFNYDALYA